MLIWGCGGRYEFAHASWVRDECKADMLGFIDNNPEMRGTLVDGYPVYAPSDLAELTPEVILVASYAYSQISQQLYEIYGKEAVDLIMP
jgi:hypothetical protein